MKTSTIIEKYHHQMTKSQLIFYTWFCDKYPEGVMRSKINYPHIKDSNLDKSVLPDLFRIGALKSEGLGTQYSKVVPA